MNKEIYEIIKRVFNVDNLEKDINEVKELIYSSVIDEKIDKKTTLFTYLINMQNIQYEEIKQSKKLSLATNDLINSIYLKLFFDVIILIDNDIFDFQPLSIMFEMSGEINEELHPYLKTMLKINALLVENIKYLYNNYSSLDIEHFPTLKNSIINILTEYKDDQTSWNTIIDINTLRK